MGRSLEYQKVSKYIKKAIDEKDISFNGWDVKEIIKDKNVHGDDLICMRKSKDGTKRKIIIEIKYGGNKFHTHFIDSLGELLFHMKDSEYYHEYGVGWHMKDKNKFIEKINKMSSGWRRLGKLNCRWVIFADNKGCEKYSWCYLLNKS